MSVFLYSLLAFAVWKAVEVTVGNGVGVVAKAPSTATGKVERHVES